MKPPEAARIIEGAGLRVSSMPRRVPHPGRRRGCARRRSTTTVGRSSRPRRWAPRGLVMVVGGLPAASAPGGPAPLRPRAAAGAAAARAGSAHSSQPGAPTAARGRWLVPLEVATHGRMTRWTTRRATWSPRGSGWPTRIGEARAVRGRSRGPAGAGAAADLHGGPGGDLDARAGAGHRGAVPAEVNGRRRRHLPRVVGPRPAAADRRAGAGGRIAGYQVCDWILPLASDPLLSRGHVGDGYVDFALDHPVGPRRGYTGDVEVEIFNEDVWSAPGDGRARTMADRYVRHVPAPVTVPLGRSSRPPERAPCARVASPADLGDVTTTAVRPGRVLRRTAVLQLRVTPVCSRDVDSHDVDPRSRRGANSPVRKTASADVNPPARQPRALSGLARPSRRSRATRRSHTSGPSRSQQPSPRTSSEPLCPRAAARARRVQQVGHRQGSRRRRRGRARRRGAAHRRRRPDARRRRPGRRVGSRATSGVRRRRPRAWPRVAKTQVHRRATRGR